MLSRQTASLGLVREGVPGGARWRTLAPPIVSGAVLALLLSTEFLFQPFVWRNYALDEIMPAWAAILRDRLVVATCIAVALVAVAARRDRYRVALEVVAVFLGALAGELLQPLVDPQADAQDLLALIGRVVRWTLVGGAVAVMIDVWRSGSAMATASETARSEDLRLRRLAASTQLEMLRRQIEPHFLFNTLATIRGLQKTDPARGHHLLGRLLDYMSATLGDDGGLRSTLGSEIGLVRAYLEVCAARMAGRLDVRCDVPAELNGVAFPSLVLATLAENAIRHGIFPNDGGAVAIEARRGDGATLIVSLTDDGVGFGDETGGSGIGLANIVERMRLLYGAAATLELSANTPSGVRATIRLPLGKEDA